MDQEDRSSMLASASLVFVGGLLGSVFTLAGQVVVGRTLSALASGVPPHQRCNGRYCRQFGMLFLPEERIALAFVEQFLPVEVPLVRRYLPSPSGTPTVSRRYPITRVAYKSLSRH